MVKFKKYALITSVFFLSFITESHADESTHSIRISAIFKGWSSNFNDGVDFMLPGGESKVIDVTEGKRLSIDEAYTGQIEGGKISYIIRSFYGAASQEDSCEGDITLHKGDLTLDAIQLQFTPIAGADPKEEGPWFTCVIGKKYK